MLTHIYNCAVTVTDIARSRAFYVDTLGWEVRDDTPMGDEVWLTVAPAGAQTALALGHGQMAGDLKPCPLPLPPFGRRHRSQENRR